MKLKASEETIQMLDAVKEQQTVLNLRLQVQLLSDLVDRLDPEHDYTFGIKSKSFVKTKKVKEGGDGS